MSKKKQKMQWQQIVGILFYLVLGGICGIVIGKYTGNFNSEKPFGVLLTTAALLLFMYISIFIHIIIHELGHLVFGLVSGYSFCSFRIFSFMWIKTDGKVQFKRLSVVGTGGQCLMSPPSLIDGKFPVVLYNLGGSLMNTITSLPFLILTLFLGNNSLFANTLFIFSLTGIMIAAMNGIPMRLGVIDNDGYNALSLGKNKSALSAFWIQTQVVSLTAMGTRLKNMPKEWFSIPEDAEMKNSMTATLGVFTCNRLMDEEKFAEAEKNITHLLEIDSGITGLHKSLLICDKIYCEAIRENRTEVISELLTKEQIKFMKSMKNFPSVIRTQYVLALFCEKNTVKAYTIKKQFINIEKTYPYKPDIESEKELMEIADKLFSEISA